MKEKSRKIIIKNETKNSLMSKTSTLGKTPQILSTSKLKRHVKW